MKQIVIFAAVLAVVCLGGAALLVRMVPGADAARAVWTSAWLAVGVQGVGFGFAWSLRKDHVMLGWGAAMMLRFVSLAVYALVGVRAMGLSLAPALLSLAGFFFVTTLVEPILLKP